MAAQGGIQAGFRFGLKQTWIPASAGMTKT
jgi:hypothetical protein